MRSAKADQSATSALGVARSGGPGGSGAFIALQTAASFAREQRDERRPDVVEDTGLHRRDRVNAIRLELRQVLAEAVEQVGDDRHATRLCNVGEQRVECARV